MRILSAPFWLCRWRSIDRPDYSAYYGEFVCKGDDLNSAKDYARSYLGKIVPTAVAVSFCVHKSSLMQRFIAARKGQS